MGATASMNEHSGGEGKEEKDEHAEVLSTSAASLRDQGESAEAEVSLHRDDSGFNALAHAAFRAALSGPIDVLNDNPEGMTAKQKEQDPPYYPPDVIIKRLWNTDRPEYDRLKAKMFAEKKCADMDFFTEGLYTKLKENSVEFYEEETYVDYCTSLDAPNAQKRSLELEQFGQTRFFVPKFTEETSGRFSLKGYKNRYVSKMMLEGFNEMKLFDFKPNFFESDEEAAMYFEYTVRQYLPQDAFADKVSVLCEFKQLQADVSAISFSGIGQWFIRAVDQTQSPCDWPTREAKTECLALVPSNAAVVVDVSMASAFPVRDAFERYGAAAFFTAKKECVAVWIDHEAEMVFPPKEGADPLSKEARDWEFALWRYRVSLFFQGFAVGHLVTLHWGMSNSLVIGTRESLDPHHPLRELITPYIHGSISINKSAIVNLGSERGAIVRIGALKTGPPPQGLVEALADQFVYETFPEFMANKGNFPPGMLDSMPMYEDGMKLWNVILKFVDSYLELFYDKEDMAAAGPDAKTVGNDPDIVAFWAKCKSTSGGFCNLPELNFKALVEYISTCIFYFTAVHELLGNVNFMTMLPRCLSGRIRKREGFGDHPFQAAIQDWYRIICVVTSTTLQSMPMLIPQQFRSANYFFDKAAKEAMINTDKLGRMIVPDFSGVSDEFAVHKKASCSKLAMCFETYGEDLSRLSNEIATSNESRKMTFGCFDPKRLEVSISL